MQSPRPTVGILHRKRSSTDKQERSNFSSLSLLPHEFNLSLSDVDTIGTIKDGNASLQEINHSQDDLEMGLLEPNQPKIVLHTTGPRGKGHSPQDNAVLVYNTTFGGKMIFPLNKKEISIGRKDDNDIVLSDGKISKHHAIIVNLDDRYFLDF